MVDFSNNKTNDIQKLRKKVKLVVSGRNAPLILQTKVLML